MRHVDTLSRYPSIYVLQSEVLVRLKKAQLKDEFVISTKELREQKQYDDFVEKGDLLFKIVNEFELFGTMCCMKKDIIKLKHEVGHFGVQKTFEFLSIN